MRSASRYQYTEKEKYHDFKTGKKIKTNFNSSKTRNNKSSNLSYKIS